MFVKAMYNTIASEYDTADCFGSISESHKSAIEQINRVNIGYKSQYKVLDMGVGDGAFLRKLKQHMPEADYTGIDVSSEMLKRATEDMSLTTIETSAAQATRYLPPHSQDLILAHFINAYIPTAVLCEQAQTLARANGYFSMITTTYESFPIAQKHLADFISKGSILSNIVGHYYKAVVKNTPVAANEDDLLYTLKQHQFQVLEHRRLHIPITLNNIDELALFGINGSWFINTLSIPMLPRNFLLQRIKRMLEKIFTFPYQDTHVIDVILAKK